ncbi:scinderin like a [Synchiropus splendidus]|uniref:scinderin like a n=1 Tax=Synchiropus splendidus TaxID=270530 RepID=UPI00237E7629|nr:scinderin like a [Synchiropus splendidus]
MAYHPEFQMAGKKPGLQVWRVEKMDFKAVKCQFYGKFYNGDTYIVLKTHSHCSYNIHAWIGEQASQDERGAVAIFMTQMDDYLNGVPVQFTEYQGKESEEFQSYFKHGVVYMTGGVSSGFNHVEPNVCDIMRLLHVKGRHRIRATEKPLNWDQFNTGDSFIIELKKDIYLWYGCESNPFERIKASEIAIDIRDLERMGRSELHFICEGKEPDAVIAVLGPKPSLPPASCDEVADRFHKKASLHMVSSDSGGMTTTLVANCNPFKQNMLNPNDCYVLDSPSRLFVWKGKQASQEERKAALRTAQAFIKKNNYPENTPVTLMPQGCESALFKQYFPSWLDKDESTGPTKAYTIGSIAKVEQVPFDASQLHSNKQMAAHHGMVDDGSGTVQIWRVEGCDKVPVDPKMYGQFFGGDSYLIRYSYNDGTPKYVIYMWQGLKCSLDERGGSAILAVAMDDELGGVATQVRVIQGHEPPHLLSIFKDKPLIVYLGGTSRKLGESKPSSTRLFHIRMKSNKRCYAVEVLSDSANLNTNDVFVLKSPEFNCLWKGKGSKPEEMSAAKFVASVLGGSFTEISENKEPAALWAALGGKKSYQTSPMLQNTLRPPRLFGCSNKTGRTIAVEIAGDFTQRDLAPDDVMILDAWDQIFVWVGKDSNDCEKSESFRIAKEYVDVDPAGRQDIPVTTIKQGEEPPSFTGWFHAWDSKMWEKDPFSSLLARFQ